MILGSTKISTTKDSFNNIRNHVCNSDDNENVVIFDTNERKITPEQFKLLTGDFYDMAKDFNDKYCLFSIMFNSKEGMTQEQMFSFKNAICLEFGMDADNFDVYFIQHQKQKKGKDLFADHGHLIANYRGLDHDKVVNTKNRHQREEKLARVFELEAGHKITQGAHNISVLTQLKQEGYSRLAELESKLLTDPEELKTYRAQNKRAKYTHGTMQHAKKMGKGKAFKDFHQDAHDLFKSCTTGVELKEALKHAGYSLKTGNKAAFLLEKDGVPLGSAGKCFGVKNAVLRDILAGKKNIINKSKAARKKNGAIQHGIQKIEKLDESIFSFFNFTPKQEELLIKLNNGIGSLQKIIDKLESQKINLEDVVSLRSLAKKELEQEKKNANSKRPILERRIKKRIDKIKEIEEKNNDKLNAKMSELYERQVDYFTKIKKIVSKNVKNYRSKPLPKNGKYSKGNKSRPQNLRQMMQALASSDKFRAAQRFSNTQHEYTKIKGAAPTYIRG
jgi:hypothetical protein